MTQDIIHYARTRHTTKAFDPTRRISDADIEKVRALLRFSPSSTNAQPWHFILAGSDEAKARIAKSTENRYPFNTPSILKASHVVVFASRLDMTENHLQTVLEQEDRDGRFDGDKDTFKPQMHAGRSMFVNLHRQDLKDAQHWMDKQVYLNLGQFLLGVATLGINATPMEGFEPAVLDAEFGLREKGFSSLVVVPIGYSDPEADFNAALPKSRLPYSEILTEA